jgi:anti-sigma regulatory factor (Ser/Thr protein kinase)
MQAHLQLSFEPMWPNVREIRERVGAALEHCSPQLRSAAIMTSSELVENAVKYGERVAGAKEVTFVLEANAERLSIRVVNGSTNAAGVAQLQRRVAELTGTEDKQALYLARLEEILTSPDESDRLGLYRIGVEGGFDLQLDYKDEVVTMTATRKSNA